ncbi:MAG: NADH-quinone oxidoreductase subunit C [Spirosomaceae bacterium]|nr:NADH-quinone oxidoreductase subunit C [Spirosomataceae bacterium]
MITNQTVVDDLVTQFGTSVTEFEQPYGMLTFTTIPEQIVEILAYLKNHKTLKFNFLTDITGVHFPDVEEKEFCVVYHLHSLENNVRVRIKVYLPEANLHIPTVIPVFVGANWMERETFDFYGIIFDGHPKMERILNMEDMDYHPMRKQYPLEDATRDDKIDALFGR